MSGIKKINDGGLAFPGARYEQVGTMRDHGGDTDEPTFGDITHPGMTLRDWFAGMAMSGMLGGQPGSHLAATKIGKESYDVADAMIAARKAGS